jgi:hypothetical protein
MRQLAGCTDTLLGVTGRDRVLAQVVWFIGSEYAMRTKEYRFRFVEL